MKKIVLIILLSIFSIKTSLAIECTKGTFSDTKEEKVTFNIKLAETPEERATGLMNIRSLPEEEGMLFIWEEPQNIYMWMKNTFISLDLIYILDNKVVGIIENTTPESVEVLTLPNQKVNMVLEINAGLAKKYNIKQGDTFSCKK